MGIYGTIAVVVSLMYYMGNRLHLKSAMDNQIAGKPEKPTNFHQEPSITRPVAGLYYRPTHVDDYSPFQPLY
jgi:hypothetical protein